MTEPVTFATVGEGGEKRDPSEYIPWKRMAQVKTPRGVRPGKLIVVRPLRMRDEWREKVITRWKAKGDWIPKLAIVDLAVLDPIEPGVDEWGEAIPGFQAGHQFRNALVLPGRLNQAFGKHIGATLIGMVHVGEAQGENQPPFLFQDLSGDQAAVARGQSFLTHRPEFLIPVEAQFTDTTAAPATEVWANAPAQQSYASQPPQRTGGQTVMYTQHEPAGWHPPTGWEAPQSAPPASAPPAPALSTLDQLKQANAVGPQGQPQNEEPPF